MNLCFHGRLSLRACVGHGRVLVNIVNLLVPAALVQIASTVPKQSYTPSHVNRARYKDQKRLKY